jgi:cation-transporting P-type ATPase C
LCRASTAVTIALAHAARNGVLIKGGVYLEQFGNVDCICVDKTGTLTEPLPTVVEVIPRTPQITTERILSLAAAAQCHNTHPIAKALVQAAPTGSLPGGNAVACETILGRGVRAQFGSDAVTVGNQALMKGQAIETGYFKSAIQFKGIDTADQKDAKALIFSTHRGLFPIMLSVAIYIFFNKVV